MSEKNKQIPHSECVQGTCLNIHTGCWGECGLRLAFPLNNVACGDPVTAPEAPYRVAEFWSSANPGTKVRMLAEGADIAAWSKRGDFIRWVDAPVAAPEAPASHQGFAVGDSVVTTDSFRREGTIRRIYAMQGKPFNVVGNEGEGEGGMYGAWELAHAGKSNAATTASASGRKEMDIWNAGAKALADRAPAGREAAPLAAAEIPAHPGIKTWQERCDWLSDQPATKLMVAAMKTEIADLRAALEDSNASFVDLQKEFDQQNDAFHATALKLKDAEEKLAAQQSEEPAAAVPQTFKNPYNERDHGTHWQVSAHAWDMGVVDCIRMIRTTHPGDAPAGGEGQAK